MIELIKEKWTKNCIYIFYLLHWHYSPMRPFASIMDLLHIPLSLDCSFQLLYSFHQTFPRPHFWFPNRLFLRGEVVNPTPNPQPGGLGPIFITPRHWVPILIAFYEMHRLQWEYSLMPITTRENLIYYLFKGLINC